MVIQSPLSSLFSFFCSIWISKLNEKWMEQIRSKPAFPRKATVKTWVFRERQKANQQIAGADKNIDIKTRRPGHRQAQFYISNN